MQKKGQGRAEDLVPAEPASIAAWLDALSACGRAEREGGESAALPSLSAAEALRWARTLLASPAAFFEGRSDDDVGLALQQLLFAGHEHSPLLLAADPALELPARLALLARLPVLFREVVAARLPADRLSADPCFQVGRRMAPLPYAAYMLWDVAPIAPAPRDPGRAPVDGACLDAMAAILAIPHALCQESALHGLGHWGAYRGRVEAIIDPWLARRALRVEALRPYAMAARGGSVM